MIRYLRIAKPGHADANTLAVYAQMKREFGSAVEPFALHSAEPRLLAGVWSACRESLLVGRVPRFIKETVATTVSRENACPYCVDAHSIMLTALGSSGIPNTQSGIAAEDPEWAEILRWAASTNRPDDAIIKTPPFKVEKAPELIGTAVIFHYINRMASVLLDDSPLPVAHGPFKHIFARVAAWYFSAAIKRKKTAGASLGFIPESDLPSDFTWSQTSPHVAAAFAGLSRVMNDLGEQWIAKEVRDCVEATLKQWKGEPPGLGRGWVDAKIEGLEPGLRPAGRLALLTALAPYQVDENIVSEFRAFCPQDSALLALLAWSSFAAARKVGKWLGASFVSEVSFPHSTMKN